MTAPTFIVTYKGTFHGRRVTGTYEMDFDRMTHSNIVQDIIDGQFSDVDRVFVLEMSTATGGIFTDVTDAFAKAVADQLIEDQRAPSYDVMCWLHRVHPRGVMSTHGMVEAA